MSAFDDEIGGLMEDIRRYSRGDERIEFCLVEMLKRINVEVDCLADEARQLDMATTASEQTRIRAAEHNRHVEWRGNDY